MQLFSNYRKLSLSIILLLGILFAGVSSWAQVAKPGNNAAARERQRVQDSTNAARKAAADALRISQKNRIDSTRASMKHVMDSARNSRQHVLDSSKQSRQKITDSLTRVRKYRESKRYQDSVTKSRQAKLNVIRQAQKTRLDSARAVQRHSTDSAIASRRHILDSSRAILKVRTDSLARIRKYRESKRFKDSVFIVRKARLDSIKTVRKAFTDSLTASRKHIIDSARTARKHISDSATAARKKITDSLGVVRKARADSLEKKKAEREKIAKAKAKQQESLLNMKLEVKIKQKRQKFSNENMLKKKWIVPRQVVQNTFTRYNYYFNARKKMDEAEANMQRVAKDNFNNRIDLFSFDPNRDSTLLSSDMDSIIRKASVGIQIHDPRTKWGDDLYLLLGQAYYYKGNYENANASFRYIIGMRAKAIADKAKRDAYKNSTVRGKREAPSVVEDDKKKLLDFLKHQSVNNEALLWVARTMTQSGKYSESEAVLDLLSHDAKFPEELKGRLALELAFLDLKENNTRSAAEHLVVVANDNSQAYFIRRRAAYLAGQLLQEGGKYTEAAAQFDKVTDLMPKIDMDFYARKNKAYNLMLAGGDQTEAIASLKFMLRDGKYATYNEQIYYILGRLSLNAGNTAEAEQYLRSSLASAKSTKKQKASSFALLGNIYYNGGRWDDAKLAYDSASYLSANAMDDDAVVVARQRSKVLDQVSVPEHTISTQDSLLALAALTEKEQRAVVRRYIRQLQQQREDSIFRAQNAADNPAAGNDDNIAQGAMTWYFSTPNLVQQGFNEFKRKWGNRPLVDNWQRMASIGNVRPGGPAASGSDTAGTGGNAVAKGDVDENGLPTEQSLMAGIPATQQQKDAAVRSIQRAYVDLGTAYVKALEDYPRANKALDTLDKRYATHPFTDEELYVRYLLALRQNNLPLAQQTGKRLQDEFPASKWAEMVKPSGDATEANAQITVAAYYDDTYSQLVQHNYSDALSKARTGRKRYNDEVYGKRFQIVEGMALSGAGDYKQADTLLSEFIRNNQNDTLRGWAEHVLKFVKQQRVDDSIAHPEKFVPAAPASTADTAKKTAGVPAAADGAAVKAATTAPASGTSGGQTTTPATYTYTPSEEHNFVFYFKSGMGPKVMGVKAGLNDFNAIKFSNQNLATSVEMLHAPDGMIVVKKFANAAQAKIYLNEFKRSPNMTREFAETEFQVLTISSPNLLKLLADKNIQAYLTFYKSKY